MNKRILLAIAIVCSCASAAGAAGVPIPSTGTSLGTQAFRPSNNVTITVESIAGTPTAPGSYSAVSSHASGDRYFGTNSTQSIIYWQTKGSAPTVTATTTGPTAPDFTTSGWTSL